MARTSDTVATTFKEKKPAKIVSHLEIHPHLGGGHSVHTVHTDNYAHPAVVKKFGAEEGHKLVAHVSGLLGIPKTEEAAGTEENVSAKEGAEI